MSTGTILAIVIPVAVLILLIVAAFALDRRRRRRLRERFGPEYDRTVDEAGSRRAAERDLGEREKRHDSLDIKPLPDDVRERYLREWQGVQEQFVDRPETAVHDADRLVSVLMRERGYPTEDFEQQTRDLSVEHGRALEHYREAHEIDRLTTSHRATTEQLRGAMVHYRALFDELLSDGHQAGPAGPER
ncbi:MULTISPECIES: hypothetical protein [Streptomyces]|uniref:Putative secreted protein n=1 Tax=Streptomyces venezuelae (strain ATCC 10712 / CBS 650.69 / DSM 40230 / JCM 4526 / NBRC 13096 / PD 04745) TaxID=953739 RepID=F2RHN5_STRVP|nr:hypothetical protein [Streptomyces venezuelae]APE25377.1 hypothetical protein vnz_33010 [Streptomyces venezuelae]QES02716.1 hypothetical protein DEJ43_33550 [Streptomyces venezuelae ATCC 10712]QES09695.1 hypothetical protein DEJ44_31390 [Streptomyces venezuelae]CCA59979.1 putative secreted protein [Streptomyces venezuelae ATCC 10712]